MYIEYLNLLNFRNYEKLNLKLCKNINVFIGDNAQGKTNILESIYYCSIGKSHRTNKEKELIKWDCSASLLEAYVVRDRINKKIEIKIFEEGKKGIRVNSIKVSKIAQLMGNLNVVMFSPEDLKIVKESPVFRRKFLDIELCKLNNRYYHDLVQYNKVLNERNIVLKKWIGNNLQILDVYDEQLLKYGSYLIKERDLYIKKLNNIGKKIHSEITSGNENIEFKYLASVRDMKNIENELRELLIKNRKKDCVRRITSIGPHRDDFSININNVDTRSYGSQGQQRTSVLTIKFTSLEIIKETIGEYPVLLLDDVLSELDAKRQKYILNSIKNIQTIITCTGIGDIKKYLEDEVQLFVVKNGVVDRV